MSVVVVLLRIDDLSCGGSWCRRVRTVRNRDLLVRIVLVSIISDL